MDFRIRLLLIFIISQHITSSKSSRSFDIRWTKSNCSITDFTWMRSFDCPIKELAKNRGNYLEVHFMPKQDINNIILFITLSMLGPKNKANDFLKFRTNACKLNTFQSKSPIVAAIFKNLIKGDNFSKSCPIYGNFSYNMSHFALNPDYFPGYTPEMNFSTTLILYVVKKPIIYTYIVASITKRKSKF